MPVNKKEFADRMAAKGGIKKKDAMKGLNLFIETLMDCMSGNEKVKLIKFWQLSDENSKRENRQEPTNRAAMHHTRT